MTESITLHAYRAGALQSNGSSTNSFGNLLAVHVMTADPSGVFVSKQSACELITASL